MEAFPQFSCSILFLPATKSQAHSYESAVFLRPMRMPLQQQLQPPRRRCSLASRSIRTKFRSTILLRLEVPIGYFLRENSFVSVEVV